MYRSDSFDRMNAAGRKVLSLAQEEAQRFNHNYIGTEHLLLGLVRLDEGPSAEVFKNLGIELGKVRNSVEFIIGRGDRIVLGEINLTPRSKKVISLAFHEAHLMQREDIGPEHLLLGLVREGEGIAAGVLMSLGVDLEKVRQETYKVLGLPPPEGLPPAGHTGSQRVIQSTNSWASASFGASTGVLGPAALSLVSPFQRYRPWHIDAEQWQRMPVGSGTMQKAFAGTLLGWVMVNTGGAFTLTLYDGLEEDAPSLAVITNPPTGAYFPFHCLVRQGLSYRLTGTPGSVTIIYDDLSG